MLFQLDLTGVSPQDVFDDFWSNHAVPSEIRSFAEELVLGVHGDRRELDRWIIGVFRSTDHGAHWELLSKVVADHDQHEASMVRLQDGRLVMITRPEGALSWSTGSTHTPGRFRILLYTFTS